MLNIGIEQPGQPSPSAKLNAIRRIGNELLAALAEWTVCHDSDAPPFRQACEHARQGIGHACELGKALDRAAAELMAERESC